MLNDADVSEVISWHYQTRANKVVESLEKNDIKAIYVPDRQQALARLVEMIPKNATIGIGDSVTLHQIGFHQWLKQQKNTIYNPFLRHPDGKSIYNPIEHFEILRKAMITDIYVTSSNAVTLDGKLISLDGRGNRVAAMLFGPKKVILVIGANKIVSNVDEAIARVKMVAPMNQKRHIEKHGSTNSKLACLTTGYCMECKSKDKCCRKWVIIDGQSVRVMSPEESGINVILVGEDLGL